MGRTARDNRDLPHPDPVDKIELSRKHLKLRGILTAVFLLIGVSAFIYAAVNWFSAESGWTEISVSSSEELHCGDDFVFLYELGVSGVPAATESRALTSLYTEACQTAYQMFTNDAEYEDMNNVFSINGHPNEELEVEPALYEAFAALEEYGNRYIYLAPVYSYYDNIFYVNDDSLLDDYDPNRNAEIAAEYETLAAFASDEEAVRIELLGENRIRLYVSEEYLSWAQEHGYTDFVDFYWMKNAFIADYLADTLAAGGYTCGMLSSYDGFVRNLDERETVSSYTVVDREDQNVRTAAVMEYSGKLSLVYLRDYMLYERDSIHYYELADGTIRTPYLSLEDGKNREAVHDLICYSRTGSCAEVLLGMMDLYIAPELDTEALYALAEDGIYTVLTEESTVFYNDPEVSFPEIGENYQLQYVGSISG